MYKSMEDLEGTLKELPRLELPAKTIASPLELPKLGKGKVEDLESPNQESKPVAKPEVISKEQQAEVQN